MLCATVVVVRREDRRARMGRERRRFMLGGRCCVNCGGPEGRVVAMGLMNGLAF